MSESTENAFTPAFLDLLEQLDEEGPAEEAELAGPWKVLPEPSVGFGLYEMWQEPAQGDRPFALFGERHLALKFAAALSAASRDPSFSLKRSRGPLQFAVLSRQGTAGFLGCFHERVLEMAHMADFCARSPRALAALLLAAGPTTLRKAGFILRRSLAMAPAFSARPEAAAEPGEPHAQRELRELLAATYRFLSEDPSSDPETWHLLSQLIRPKLRHSGTPDRKAEGGSSGEIREGHSY